MAQLTVLPNGVTASFPRLGPIAQPAKRGKIHGWSRQSTQRLRRWFFSVDGDALAESGDRGFALSHTILDLPPTGADWTKTLRRFEARLRRAGAVRGQWLTEWQKRGVPHMHGIVYFPGNSGVTREDVVAHWLGAAADWGPGAGSQNVKPVWGLPGWLQYQAKHSVRGVKHYQRANVPEAWREGTGKLWGAWGDWPVREEVIEVSTASFHRFRRLMQGWLLGGARVELAAATVALGTLTKSASKSSRTRVRKRAWAARRRVGFLSQMMKCGHVELSPVRAVGEFCPEGVARELLAAAELRSSPTAVVDLATGEVLTGWAGLEAACRGPVECLGRS